MIYKISSKKKKKYQIPIPFQNVKEKAKILYFILNIKASSHLVNSVKIYTHESHPLNNTTNHNHILCLFYFFNLFFFSSEINKIQCDI